MIRSNFNNNAIKDYIRAKIKQNINAIVETYKFVGEKFVIDARSKTSADGGFNDITGNLRSSIGYIVLLNGNQVNRNFDAAPSGSEGGSTGKKKGLDFALEIAQKYPKGVVLIAVAGMEYAAAVESRGKDVIDGSSKLITDRLKTYLKNL